MEIEMKHIMFRSEQKSSAWTDDFILSEAKQDQGFVISVVTYSEPQASSPSNVILCIR